MWTVRIRTQDTEGVPLEVPIAQRSGELPSSSLALLLARQLRDSENGNRYIRESLLAYLEEEARQERESEGFSGGRRAVQDVRRRMEFPAQASDSSSGLLSILESNNHVPTIVVVPLNGKESAIELEFDLRSGLDGWHHHDPLRNFWRHHDHSPYYLLDWRAYLGDGSLLLDGKTLDQWGANEFRSPFTSFLLRDLPQKAGFLVGYVLRQVPTWEVTLPEYDPTFEDRCRKFENLSPDLARSVPRIESIQLRQVDTAVIWVHGTLSHSIEGLQHLPPGLFGDAAAFRFEHDTFRPVRENGLVLAEAIRSRLTARRLVLIAHSRGGLVARYARAGLSGSGSPRRVQIFTFGTPHDGTPLVDTLRTFPSALFRVGHMLKNKGPQFTDLEYLFSSLAGLKGLPEGIKAMAYQNRELAAMNRFDKPRDVKCWAARFSIDQPDCGYSFFADGLLSGILHGLDNDLVVPTESALAFGKRQDALECSHSGYFQQEAVQSAIRRVCQSRSWEKLSQVLPELEEEYDRFDLDRV